MVKCMYLQSHNPYEATPINFHKTPCSTPSAPFFSSQCIVGMEHLTFRVYIFSEANISKIIRYILEVESFDFP